MTAREYGLYQVSAAGLVRSVPTGTAEPKVTLSGPKPAAASSSLLPCLVCTSSAARVPSAAMRSAITDALSGAVTGMGAPTGGPCEADSRRIQIRPPATAHRSPPLSQLSDVQWPRLPGSEYWRYAGALLTAGPIKIAQPLPSLIATASSGLLPQDAATAVVPAWLGSWSPARGVGRPSPACVSTVPRLTK